MSDIITSSSQHQPAFITQSNEQWAITYPVQPNEDPVTGHTHSLSEFLSGHTAPTFLSVKEDSFLLIPDELFDENQQADYRRFLSLKDGEIMRYIRWPQSGCTYVYSALLAPEHKGALHTYPQAWAIQNALFGMYDNLAESSFAIIFGNEVLLFFYRQNKLVFYNRFLFENYDELAYYVLQSIKESNASTEKPLKLIAEGYSAGRAHENLSRFIATDHITTGRLPVLNELNLLEEINLYGLQQCALSVAG